MNKDEMRSQLLGELSQAQSSAILWGEQVRVLEGTHQAVASRAMKCALTTIRELTAVIEDVDRA